MYGLHKIFYGGLGLALSFVPDTFFFNGILPFWTVRLTDDTPLRWFCEMYGIVLLCCFWMLHQVHHRDRRIESFLFYFDLCHILMSVRALSLTDAVFMPFFVHVWVVMFVSLLDSSD